VQSKAIRGLIFVAVDDSAGEEKLQRRL